MRSAERARNFLLDLNHAKITLGEIVIKGDAKIVHESENPLFVKLKSVE